MNQLQDVCIGSWREGLNKAFASQVEQVEKNQKTGLRQLPYESTVFELARMLDLYEEFYLEACWDRDAADAFVTVAVLKEPLPKATPPKRPSARRLKK
jgi:hypothetical protein